MVVVVVIGAGSMGQAIARRVGAGKHTIVADVRSEVGVAAAEVLVDAGFDASSAVVDVSSRELVHGLTELAASFGDVVSLIHTAGVSPSQASAATVLAVDLYGTAVVLDEFRDGTAGRAGLCRVAGRPSSAGAHGRARPASGDDAGGRVVGPADVAARNTN